MEARGLGCLKGKGSPQDGVKQTVPVRGDRGTTLATTEGWRAALEARPGRDSSTASWILRAGNFLMGYEKSEKEDGDACQEANACSGVERQEAF